MFQNKKRMVILGVMGLCVIFLIILACLTVGVAGKPGEAGGCIAISFDKWDMQRADKVIMYYNGQEYVITDVEFVRTLTAETMAGTFQDYCCANLDDGYMEIYRGERLIRTMRYIQNHDAFAYEADAGHWVLFGEEGHAFLSRETAKQLEARIKAG